MDWRWSGDQLLSEPMMVSLQMHICVSRHQWVRMCVKPIRHFNLTANIGTTIPTPFLEFKSLQFIWRLGTRRWNLRVSNHRMSCGELITWQDTRRIAPAIATRRHAPFWFQTEQNLRKLYLPSSVTSAVRSCTRASWAARLLLLRGGGEGARGGLCTLRFNCRGMVEVGGGGGAPPFDSRSPGIEHTGGGGTTSGCACVSLGIVARGGGGGAWSWCRGGIVAAENTGEAGPEPRRGLGAVGGALCLGDPSANCNGGGGGGKSLSGEVGENCGGAGGGGQMGVGPGGGTGAFLGSVEGGLRSSGRGLGSVVPYNSWGPSG